MPEANPQSGGFARGNVRLLLRLEALAALVGATAAYRALQGHWLWFAVFFLAPDVSLVAYTLNPRFGAAVYNLAHTYVAPAVLLAVGAAMRPSLMPFAALIWTAHIALDRVLGYGLKYASSFGHTHMGLIGPAKRV